MQVFQAIEIPEYPYMKTIEVSQGETVKDILSQENEENVYLLVDHDHKRIWTFNGPKSPFKLQIYGGILAQHLRKQLRLFYRIFFLNKYHPHDKEFQEVMEKPLGGGRAQPIDASQFPDQDAKIPIGADLCVHLHLKPPQALEYISEIPSPEGYTKRFSIIGGGVYANEDFIEKFVKENEKKKHNPKIAQLNRGFTSFVGYNYSTRLIIKDRKVQAIELYTKDSETRSRVMELRVPIIQEEKLSKKGDMNKLLGAFEVPEKLPDVEAEDTAESQ